MAWKVPGSKSAMPLVPKELSRWHKYLPKLQKRQELHPDGSCASQGGAWLFISQAESSLGAEAHGHLHFHQTRGRGGHYRNRHGKGGFWFFSFGLLAFELETPTSLGTGGRPLGRGLSCLEVPC